MKRPLVDNPQGQLVVRPSIEVKMLEPLRSKYGNRLRAQRYLSWSLGTGEGTASTDEPAEHLIGCRSDWASLRSPAGVKT